MCGQNAELGSSKLGNKLLLFVGVSLIVLSLSSLAIFVVLSALSLVTWSGPQFWNACFCYQQIIRKQLPERNLAYCFVLTFLVLTSSFRFVST
jgi:hypothetical protein